MRSTKHSSAGVRCSTLASDHDIMSKDVAGQNINHEAEVVIVVASTFGKRGCLAQVR